MLCSTETTTIAYKLFLENPLVWNRSRDIVYAVFSPLNDTVQLYSMLSAAYVRISLMV
jgi:hypothetical protein